MFSHRVTAKGFDVVLYPLQTEQDVLECHVALDLSAVDREPAERAEAVVDRDKDSVGGSEVAAIVQKVGYASGYVRSAVDEHFHR
jgi:hypothetical protein